MLHTLITFVSNFMLYVVSSIALYNVLLVIVYFRQVRFAWNVNGFFIPCLPFVGTAYLALFAGSKVNILGTMNWISKHFGKPFNFWFGHQYHYITGDVEETKIVLNHPKCYTKAQIYERVQYVFKKTLLLLPGEEWKPRRHYFRTCFKFNLMKALTPTFYEQSCILNNKLRSLRPSEDLYGIFNNYSFLNFAVTMGGLNGCDVNPAIKELGALFDEAQDELIKYMLNPIVPAFLWTWTPACYKLDSIIQHAEKLLREILQNKIKLRAESPDYIENSKEAVLIDLLLNEVSAGELNYDTVVEFGLFGVAVADTTGHTLAFCFTVLGIYPEMQQRVYEEVISVVGGGSIDEGHLPGLKYTEAFICELLRILPSVPLFGRYCEVDVDLGKKVIPKGSNFVVNVFDIHRSPVYWPDPLKFDPSRFFPENASKIVPGSYLPFSSGPRNCIGQWMAMVMLKVTVASVVRQFQITSSHKSINEFTFESCITLKALEPLHCRFHPRMTD